MASKTLIPEGYELLVGRNRANARAAIEMAEARGFPTSSVRTVMDGYLIPGAEPAVATVEEIILPDPAKATHEEIDAFAAEWSVSYDGLSDKATKAEKVDHIDAVLAERAAQNDEALASTGELTEVSKEG